MQNISSGLACIHHDCNLIHKDLHLGNVLQRKNDHAYISDFGFCKPADEISNSRNIYGVMNEIISIVPPFNDVPHYYHLALDICRGKRPKIREETPEPIKRINSAMLGCKSRKSSNF